MQILVPYIGLNNPETILQAHNSNNILRHWTQISRYQAPMKTLKVMQSPLFTHHLQTTLCCPQLRCNRRSYKLTFSLPDPHSLFYMPLNLRLGPLQILLIPQHHAPYYCIKTFRSSSARPDAAEKSATHQAASPKNQQKRNLPSNSPPKCSLIFLFPPKTSCHFFLASCTSFPCICCCPPPENHKHRRFFFFFFLNLI